MWKKEKSCIFRKFNLLQTNLKCRRQLRMAGLKFSNFFTTEEKKKIKIQKNNSSEYNKPSIGPMVLKILRTLNLKKIFSNFILSYIKNCSYSIQNMDASCKQF